MDRATAQAVMAEDTSWMEKVPCGIQLTQGKVALVDAADFEWLSQWKWFHHAGGSGGTNQVTYAARRGDGQRKLLKMHRFIMGDPVGFEVDHIDGNGLNNQRSNLRLATRSQNVSNMVKRLSNTSGFKGVCWSKDKNKWSGYIKVNYKSHFLGYFDDKEEAARAYDRAALIHHGEFAKTNEMLGLFELQEKEAS